MDSGCCGCSRGRGRRSRRHSGASATQRRPSSVRRRSPVIPAIPLHLLLQLMQVVVMRMELVVVVVVVAVGIRVAVVMRRRPRPAHILRHAGI